MTENTFILALAELAQTGTPFVHVTLVQTTGSTPQDAGSKMLVDRTGRVYGTVGGGKVEARSIEHAQAMISDSKLVKNILVEWNLQRDIGMTCGGWVKLFFEVYNRCNWRIVVFGAGHVSQALIRCLLTLDCRIVCLDTRPEWLNRLPDSNRLDAKCLDPLSDYTDQITDQDFVICMTMGHSTDRPILEAIFRRNLKPAFLGVIGSKSKRGVLIRELKSNGIDSHAAEQFVCPIGLPIGTNHPNEIAISVAAQLLEVRDRIGKQELTLPWQV